MSLIKSYAFSILGFFFILFFFVFLASQNIDWNIWRTATCMPDACFCEAIRNGETVRQPANTISSLIYALIGLIILGHNFSIPEKRPFTRKFALLFSMMLLAVGLGSAFYHASLSFLGQFADVFSMYLMASFILVYAWHRLYSLATIWVMALYLLINLGLGLLLYFVPESRRDAFAIVLLIALAFEIYYAAFRKPSLRRAWFNYGLLVFAIAYGIWMLDNSRTVCSPESLIQGHALWHILGAIATGMLYRYYLSETN